MIRGEHKGKEGVIKAIDNTRNLLVVDGLGKVPAPQLRSELDSSN